MCPPSCVLGASVPVRAARSGAVEDRVEEQLSCAVQDGGSDVGQDRVSVLLSSVTAGRSGSVSAAGVSLCAAAVLDSAVRNGSGPRR